MLKDIKLEVKSLLEKEFNKKYENTFEFITEEPKKLSMGDIAIPVFSAVKILRKPPFEVAKEVNEVLSASNLPIKKIDVVGGYVNLFIDKEKAAASVIKEAITNLENYGSSNIGENKTIVMDYSSPNIAKSFSIGHLRSTVIGNSLKLILQKCGYNTVAINYVGDWGTQFGKMIVAIEKWGNIEEIKKDPINILSELYVRINNEEKEHPELAEEAREAFRKIELGEEKYVNMWRWIREESLKESEEIYKLLDVEFDSYNGEAFFNDKMQPVIDILEEKGLLKEDQGAQIVDLGDDIPPALIKRSDGGSLYITRDLAAVMWRKKEYNADKILYVVGGEQKLHFIQLKAVLEKMGLPYYNDIEHINFGLVLKDGKKMSTRKGNVVKLYDLLMQAISQAKVQIEEKNPDLPDKDMVARSVGVGAIVFNDLKNYRALDYEFDVDQMVKFEGQTGPYLQYTGVRIESIIKGQNIDLDNLDLSLFEKEHYYEVVKTVGEFKDIIEEAAKEYAPSVIARYLLDLASSFNKFYSLERINAEDEKVRNTNFALAKSVRIVLNEGLRLLGIKYLEKM